MTAAAGVANERWGQGVCAGDIDNDGASDLYVTNFGPNRLFRNLGDGRFADVAVRSGVAVDSWSTGCAFGDYDGDGWLDLYVAGYVAFDVKNPPPAPPRRQGPAADAAPPPGSGGMGAAYSAGAAYCTYRGLPVMCGPRGLRGAPDFLFRNNGDGTFTDTTRQAGVTDTKGLYGFGVAWLDMDDDGRLDLLVANDSGPNYVYRNAGQARFEDISYPSGAALDGSGREQAHMGVAIGDYDNDGRDDIHITNFADDFNVLYRNHDGTSVTDVSFRSGIAQVSIPFLGWGTDFLDYDNDGWLDLLVVNGHVYPAADTMPWNTSYAQRALLFRNLKGARFEDVGAAAGDGLTDAAGVARVGGRRSRQRRRHRRRHQQHRRRAHGGAQRRGRRGRPLADDPARRRSRPEVPARRDRLGGVRHGRRRAAPRGSRQRPRPDLPVGPPRALRPGPRDDGGKARGAMGRRGHGFLCDRPGGCDRHDRSEDRAGSYGR